MVFNDILSKNGAIQKCEEWLFGRNYGVISNNPDLLLTFTNLINSGLDKTKSLLYAADNTWQDDDVNYTTYNYETTDLSDGVAEYTIDKSHGIIEGLEIMHIDGKYYQIYQIDNRDLLDTGYTETSLQIPTSIPTKWDINGNVLTLMPKPSATYVTLTDGLKIRFKRESKYFDSSATTTELGIPRMFHDIPCLFACNEFAKQNSMGDKVKDTGDEINKRSFELKDHMAKRNKTDTPIITSESVNSI